MIVQGLQRLRLQLRTGQRLMQGLQRMAVNQGGVHKPALSLGGVIRLFCATQRGAQILHTALKRPHALEQRRLFQVA